MKQEIQLVVRSYECDSYGHVNHAVYVNYLEHARVRYLQAAGHDYAGMVAAGYFMVVIRLDVAYRRPAYAHDELSIETEPKAQRRAGGTIHQVIRRGEEVLVEADVTWCLVDREGRPTKPPAAFDVRGLFL